MQLISRIPGLLLSFLRRAWRRARMYLLLSLFKEHGKDIWFDPDGTYSFENISLGSDVSLGLCPVMTTANSTIRIGSHVMFGPHVTVIGGNHNTDEIGQFMTKVNHKRPGDDLGVVIEDDVWVGAGATILCGVVVGRGSIVAAGSVVTRDVPAYAVVAGCPARVLKFRWDVESLVQHEESLYSPESRIRESSLRLAFKQFAETQGDVEP
jgi:acetyltransferase-like isoleucine patch superfamily enzyme